MTAHENPHLYAALAAAEHGYRVFPLAPGAKTPAIEGWEAAANADPDRIWRWWTWPGHDRHGVGIACGPSGLLVIDCDRPKPGQTPPGPDIADGADALAAVAEQAGAVLPFDTHTVGTASGGLHLYYRTGDGLRNSRGRLGWLIDTRGVGGYVVAAGTRLAAGRTYTTTHDALPAPLPGWLAERLTRPPRLPAPVAPVATDRLDAYLAAAVNAVVERVSRAAVGTHNDELYFGAMNLGRLVAGGSLPHQIAYDALMAAEHAIRARCDRPEHTDRQADKTILSGFKAGAQRPRTITPRSTPRTGHTGRTAA